jgi:ActR/RegA family two-component response regulator
MIMRALRAMDVSIPELARILEMRRWGLQRLGSQRQHCGPARVDQPAD